MRRAPDLGGSSASTRRRRWLIGGAAVILLVLLIALKSLATLYTDELWFSSIGQRSVWNTLLGAKVGLFVTFGGAFFVVLWVNLLVAAHLAAVADERGEPPDELVQRFRRIVAPRSGRIYGGLAVVAALIAGSGTIGEWQNWILFRHGGSFGVKDPEFHMDVGFFVFKLPFLSFVVSWTLVCLVVVTIITVVVHYLNGRILLQRAAPRVRPAVKAHLSVLVALIALTKAAGYVLARYELDLAHDSVVEGAGYTDVHARLPALALLFWISLGAAAVLLYNIRLRGWTLPVIAVGVWAVTALAVGVIYPALLQALKVNPAQATLERPYIARNITATRRAYALGDVKTQSFAANPSLSQVAVVQNEATLNNIRLWDPDPSISLQTFQKLQDIRSFYTFPSVAVDRYEVDGQPVPVIVGVRQVNSSAVPASWVNEHLQYTHGEGLVLAEANQATADGNPDFSILDVPPKSTGGLPAITDPDIYFGEDMPGYVVADTKQPEFDYQSLSGGNVESHYTGTGGVRINSFLTKAAFAIRFNDLNLLISNLITPSSRIMFVRDVQAMAEKAAPFLSFDADPYAAVVNGHVDWILDAYTTTANYPYSQNASGAQVPPGSGLPGSYNYVRNSVKVVVNAESGAMTFYDMTTKANPDPILEAYEAAFPHMFTPASKMSATLKAHLRYPEDLFSIQAAMYGQYHITNPEEFYTAGTNGGDAWSLSPTAGVGAPSSALAVTTVTDAQGVVVGTPPVRMSPQYQVLAQPGDAGQSFTISDAYVPASQGNQVQNLAAFMMSDGDGQPGQLRLYVTPPGQSVTGPAQADSRIEQNANVSEQLSLLDQHGSNVILGNILLVPVGQSVLYVRPLYVTSSGNPQPQLQDVIAVFGQNVAMEPTLDGALSDVFGTPVGSAPPSSAPGSGAIGPLSAAAQNQLNSDLAQASADYTAAQTALKSGQADALGTYETDIAAMNAQIAAAQALLKASTASSSGATAPASSTSTSSTSSSSTSTNSSTSTTSTTSPTPGISATALARASPDPAVG